MTPTRAFAGGAISTPHYLASVAGATVLADGGNAVDAILAANLALGVVAPYYCGYGGDLLAIVWDGRLHGYRSTGRAPAGATIDAVRDAAGVTDMPIMGPHTVTVPGAVRGWFDLLERWGTRSFGALASRARELAQDGFVLTRGGAYRLGGSINLVGLLGVDDTDLRRAYADVRPGALVRQVPLVATIDALADDGPGAYYGCPIGDAVAETVQRHGGFMTAADVANHAPAWPEPMEAEFAGHRIAELPPPAQGVTALEMLRIADGFDLATDDVDRLHLFVEIAKLALADRDAYVGDPDHLAFPATRLLDHDWVTARRASIDPARAQRAEPRRTPDGGTAYLCCADRDGLLVSLIQSNFTSIGSGLHVPEWGINLHNRGSAFTFAPGHPNALAPGKIPMHTLIPALVRDLDGRPTHVFGTMGGHAQAQVHLQVLTRLLVDGAEPGEALDAPRWSADPGSGRVAIEARVPQEWRTELERRGHELQLLRDYDDGVGHAHCISLEHHGYLVAGDPRAESDAIGI